ncbi:MAG TPA: hypothetical protein VFU85_06775 [Nocardioides sp.]|nr:hypothetical protein [Nocardioides sp.]
MATTVSVPLSESIERLARSCPAPVPTLYHVVNRPSYGFFLVGTYLNRDQAETHAVACRMKEWAIDCELYALDLARGPRDPDADTLVIPVSSDKSTMYDFYVKAVPLGRLDISLGYAE